MIGKKYKYVQLSEHIAVEIPLNAEVDHAAVHKLQSPLSPLFVNVYFRTGIVCIFCPL